MVVNYVMKKMYALASYLGFKVIVRKVNEGSIAPSENQIKLQQKHVNNLKVVLDREALIKLLPKDGIVAELGVDEGDFSSKILTLSNPKKLYLIDAWGSQRYNEYKMRKVEERFKDYINSGRVIIRRGLSDAILNTFEDAFFDWAYIDTAHSYKLTQKELELCRLKVKDGGIISGHDYCMGNIDKALHYGVVQAVNEFCAKYDWEYIFLTHETDRKLSFAIRKIVG